MGTQTVNPESRLPPFGMSVERANIRRSRRPEVLARIQQATPEINFARWAKIAQQQLWTRLLVRLISR